MSAAGGDAGKDRWLFGMILGVVESGNPHGFMDFRLFRNATYTGATLSNFLVNATVGIQLVSLQLVQIAGGMSAQEAGVLTLGYAIAVVSFIRVGEKLLQRLYALFGLGLAFYATP